MACYAVCYGGRYGGGVGCNLCLRRVVWYQDGGLWFILGVGDIYNSEEFILKFRKKYGRSGYVFQGCSMTWRLLYGVGYGMGL